MGPTTYPLRPREGLEGAGDGGGGGTAGHITIKLVEDEVVQQVYRVVRRCVCRAGFEVTAASTRAHPTPNWRTPGTTARETREGLEWVLETSERVRKGTPTGFWSQTLEAIETEVECLKRRGK